MSNINYINNTPITHARVKNLLQGEEAAFIKSKSVSEYLFNTLMTIVARMPLLKKYATEWKADCQQAYQALNKIYQAAEKEIEQTYPSFHEWGSNLKELVRMHAILTKLDKQQNQLKSGNANNQEKFELRIDGDDLGLFYGNECQYMLPAKEELKTIIRDALIAPRYKKLKQAFNPDINDELKSSVNTSYGDNELQHALENVFNFDINDELKSSVNASDAHNELQHALENVFNSDIDDDNQLEQAVENLFNPDTETKYKAFFEIRSQLKETSILPFTATNLNVKHAEKTFHIGLFKFAETDPYKNEERTLAYLHHQTELLNQDSPERKHFYNNVHNLIKGIRNEIKDEAKHGKKPLYYLCQGNLMIENVPITNNENLASNENPASEILKQFLTSLTIEQKNSVQAALTNQMFWGRFFAIPQTVSKYHTLDLEQALNRTCDRAWPEMPEDLNDFLLYDLLNLKSCIKSFVCNSISKELTSNKVKILLEYHNVLNKKTVLEIKEKVDQFSKKNKINDANALSNLKNMCAYDDIKLRLTIMVDEDGNCEITDSNIKANPIKDSINYMD